MLLPRAVGRKGWLVTGIEQQPLSPPCNTNCRNRKVQASATPYLRIILNNVSERDVFNSLKYHFLLKPWPKILRKLYVA